MNLSYSGLWLHNPAFTANRNSLILVLGRRQGITGVPRQASTLVKMSHQTQAPEIGTIPHTYKISFDSILTAQSTTREDSLVPPSSDLSSSPPSETFETEGQSSSLAVQRSPIKPLKGQNILHPSTPSESTMPKDHPYPMLPRNRRRSSPLVPNADTCTSPVQPIPFDSIENDANDEITVKIEGNSVSGLFEDQFLEGLDDPKASHTSAFGDSRLPEQKFYIYDGKSTLPHHSQPHTVFTPVTDFSAKCDRCEQYNVSGIYRCQTCTIQVCEGCKNSCGLEHDGQIAERLRRAQEDYSQSSSRSQRPKNCQGLLPSTRRNVPNRRSLRKTQEPSRSRNYRPQPNPHGVVKAGRRVSYTATKVRRMQQSHVQQPRTDIQRQCPDGYNKGQPLQGAQNASTTRPMQFAVLCSQCSSGVCILCPVITENGQCACRFTAENRYTDAQLRLVKDFVLRSRRAPDLLGAFQSFLSNLRRRDPHRCLNNSCCPRNTPAHNVQSSFPTSVAHFGRSLPAPFDIDEWRRNQQLQLQPQPPTSATQNGQGLSSVPSLTAGFEQIQSYDTRHQSEPPSSVNTNPAISVTSSSNNYANIHDNDARSSQERVRLRRQRQNFTLSALSNPQAITDIRLRRTHIMECLRRGNHHSRRGSI